MSNNKTELLRSASNIQVDSTPSSPDIVPLTESTSGEIAKFTLLMQCRCFILSMSHIDSVAQTFRLRMHIETFRELSPEETELYIEDPDNFKPLLHTCIEPFISHEIIEFTPLKYNNNKCYIVLNLSQIDPNDDINKYNCFPDSHGGRKCYLILQQLYRADVIFNETLELQNFPFDVQHFGFQLAFRCDTGTVLICMMF